MTSTPSIESWRRTHPGASQTRTHHPHPVGGTSDWGVDEARLADLRAEWPHAMHMTDAGNFQCKYPLWNIRRVPNGFITDFAAHEQHRYVCGAPTSDPLCSYCSECDARLTMTPQVAARERARIRKQRDELTAASRHSGKPVGGQDDAVQSPGEDVSDP